MVYRGHIKNGVAVLDGAVALPDGTPVRVEVESGTSDFWARQTVDDLAQEQGVVGIQNANELAGDWPSEDSIDEFLSLIRGVRH